MGWKDAPLVQAKGKWADAPLIEAAPEKPKDEGRIPILSDINDFSRAFTTGVVDGMTLGFGDEITAGIETPFRVAGDLFTGRGFDPGRAFSEGLTGAQEYMASERDRNPGAAFAGDLTGSVVTGGTLAKGGVTLMNGARSIPGMIGRGAAEGAAYGAVSGFGRSDGDVDERIEGARDGALWGAGTGGVVSGVAGALAARAAKSAVPAVDDIKSAATAKYDAAKASGVRADQSKTIALSDTMHDIAVKEGLVSPTGRIDSSYPKLVEALKTFDDYANGTMTVKQMQSVRKKLQGAAGSIDKNERRIAKEMLNEMDKFTSGIAPQLREGDALYATAMRGRTIEKAIRRAEIKSRQYSNGGMENALRTEFRRLALQIEDGALRGFSPEEIAAINKVAEGGTLENIFRYIGKAAPTGIVSMGLGSGVPFSIGTALSGGNPAIGAAAAGATMGAGIIGKSAAGAMTGSNAVKAALLARNGGVAPKAIPNNSAVLDALIAAGGNQAPTIPKRMPIELLITGGNPAYAR